MLVTRFVGLREHSTAQLHINNEVPDSTQATDPSNKVSVWLVANTQYLSEKRRLSTLNPHVSKQEGQRDRRLPPSSKQFLCVFNLISSAIRIKGNNGDLGQFGSHI